MALALARAAHQAQFMAAASQRWRAVDAVDACRSQSPTRRTKAPETNSSASGCGSTPPKRSGQNQPRKLLLQPQSGRAGLRSASFARESKGVRGRWIVTWRRAPTVRSTGRSRLPP
jgi:hypothetical protein